MGIVDGTITKNSNAMSREDFLVQIHDISTSLVVVLQNAGLWWHEVW